LEVEEMGVLVQGMRVEQQQTSK